jgi:hypothetical protein
MRRDRIARHVALPADIFYFLDDSPDRQLAASNPGGQTVVWFFSGRPLNWQYREMRRNGYYFVITKNKNNTNFKDNSHVNIYKIT